MRVFGHERVMAAKKRAKKKAGAKPKAEKKTPKRMGRPPRVSTGASTSAVLVRLTAAERRALEHAAERAGKTLTAFVRDALLALCESC